MDSDKPTLPPSPFGDAPRMDLAGWRFGALLKSPSKQKMGFFIDPAYMRPRCEAYAGFAPGCSLSDAMLAVAFPAPLHSLLERWSPDWRATAQATWLGGRDKNIASVYPERCAPQSPGFLGKDARFAFISASCAYRGMDDEERFAALSQVFSLWREELESRGARCLAWTDPSLVGLSNGFLLEDILLEAGGSSDAAFARADMEIELARIPLAKSGPRPRI